MATNAGPAAIFDTRGLSGRTAQDEGLNYAASTRRNRFHSAVAAPEISTLA